MTERVYNIAKEFSRYPGGRDLSDGPYSGEEFRDIILRPLLDDNYKIVLELDGTRGYPPSFLEETFGGLVRKGYTKDILLSHITFKTIDEQLKKEILSYINDATPTKK